MLNWIETPNDYKEKQEPVALSTVTKCLSSTSCVVGSRMIVTQNQRTHVTIGGGNLEFKVIDEEILQRK